MHSKFMKGRYQNMQAYPLEKSIDLSYLMLFRIFTVFAYVTQWRSWITVNSFGKMASLCLQCFSSFHVCKCSMLRNGNMEAQGDEGGKHQEWLMEWFCVGEGTKQWPILPSELSMGENEGKFCIWYWQIFWNDES